MTGTDLKIERIRAGVKQQDVARVFGATPGRLSQIERPNAVSPSIAARYLAALAECQRKAA